MPAASHPSAPSPGALLRHPGAWAWFLGTWAGLALMWAAAYAGQGTTAYVELALGETGVWMLVCVAGAACGWALPLPAWRASPLRAVAAVLLVTLGLLALLIVLGRGAAAVVGATGVPLPILLASGVLRHLPTVASFVAAGHAVRRALQHRRRQVALARFEAEVAAARFHAVRARLRPRFLLEVLGGIAALVHRDVPAADRLLLRLAELLRLTLQDTGAETVPLGREVDFVRLFLEVGCVRAPGTPLLEVEAGAPVLSAPVPHRAVFRLVEATLALLEDAGSLPARVWIGAAADGAALRVRIRDDAALPLARRRGLAGWAELQGPAGMEGGWRFSDRPGGGVEAELLLPLPSAAEAR